jgi:probable phosphoglycerate mutase
VPGVWLIRHAPARENLDGTFMGRLDGEPDRDGLERAAALAGTIDAGVVLSSPLRRAALTAAAIFPGHAIAHDERLAERHLGDWQGRAKAEVREQCPEAFTEAGTLDLCRTPPGGESFAELSARVHALLGEIAALGGEQRVALVAHNGVLQAARIILGLTDVHSASRTPVRFAEPELVVVDAAALAAPSAA